MSLIFKATQGIATVSYDESYPSFLNAVCEAELLQEVFQSTHAQVNPALKILIWYL